MAALEADIALLDGTELTIDSKERITEAIAVRDGKIVGVGTNDLIKEHIGENTKIIELMGRAVLPGLTDAHVHMIAGGTRSLDQKKLACRDF